MNAIEMLEEQHRQVDQLFEQLLSATATVEEKRRLFCTIADKLVIHTTIEERHFYPAIETDETESLLDESIDEHREVRRLVADLIDLDPSEGEFDAKCKALAAGVRYHVEEEREETFPKARELLDDEQLNAIADEMAATMEELRENGEPRRAVLDETIAPL